MAEGEYKSGFSTAKLVSYKSIPLLAKTTFLLAGVASLIHWNFLVNVLPYIQKLFLENTDYTSSYLGLFQLANALSQFVMLKTGSRLPRVEILSAGLLCFFGFIIGVFFVEAPSTTIGIVCIHLFILFFGICDGFVQGISMSLGSIMPTNLVGFVSIGQGAVGLFSFAISTLLSFTAFDLETRHGVRYFLWITLGISGFVTLFTTVLLTIVLYHPWARERIRQIGENHDSENPIEKKVTNENDVASTIAGLDNVVEPSKENTIDGSETAKIAGKTDEDDIANEPARPLMMILKDCGFMMFLCFLHFFVSFHLYPKVGPFSWNFNQKIKNHFIILTGIFCIFEFIGRSLPDLSVYRCMRWTKIPYPIFKWLEIFRVLMFVPFILGYAVKGAAVINDFWWYCIVIVVHSFTQGWFGTLCFVYGTSSLKRLKEREVAAPLTVISVILGCAVGLFLGLPYKTPDSV